MSLENSNLGEEAIQWWREHGEMGRRAVRHPEGEQGFDRQLGYPGPQVPDNPLDICFQRGLLRMTVTLPMPSHAPPPNLMMAGYITNTIHFSELHVRVSLPGKLAP